MITPVAKNELRLPAFRKQFCPLSEAAIGRYFTNNYAQHFCRALRRKPSVNTDTIAELFRKQSSRNQDTPERHTGRLPNSDGALIAWRRAVDLIELSDVETSAVLQELRELTTPK